jgi:predicted Zn-dependent protease
MYMLVGLIYFSRGNILEPGTLLCEEVNTFVSRHDVKNAEKSVMCRILQAIVSAQTDSDAAARKRECSSALMAASSACKLCIRGLGDGCHPAHVLAHARRNLEALAGCGY